MSKLEIPPTEAPLAGGPFDGKIGYFDVKNWEPDEARYQKVLACTSA